MTQATQGDKVSIHYQGTLDDGTVFDSSAGREPLEFTLGSGAVIPGFDQAVSGMSVGDKKTVTIPAEQAYGSHNDDLVHRVPRGALPDDLTPEPGMTLQANGPQGQTLLMQVMDVSDEEILVDGNHPLAGQNLTFELELMQIG